jgi:diguanylate cyclase (GGDEF)-like protein/PAS domain S-box-containing protein
MVIVDAHGTIVLVNARTEALFGFARDDMIGQPVEFLLPMDLRHDHETLRENYSANPHSRTIEQRPGLLARRADGTHFEVEVSLNPLQTDHGTLVLSVLQDVTERNRLQVEDNHFRSVVEFSQDAIVGKDLSGVIMSWNNGARRLYGYTANEAIGKSVAMLVPLNNDDEIPELLRRVGAGEVIENHETVRTRKDGVRVNVSLTVSPIRAPSGVVIGASTIARNITERLHYQEQLIDLAERDPLTGLRNRRRFELDVADQVHRAHRYGEIAVLAMIDLNGFKKINDVHGHRIGDKFLKAVAAALKGRLRDTDMISRIGGDEFAIIMPYARLETAMVITDGLRTLISECNVAVEEGSDVHVTASVGCVEINHDTLNEESVIGEVDRLMYADKHQNLSRVPREV